MVVISIPTLEQKRSWAKRCGGVCHMVRHVVSSEEINT